MGCSFNTQGSQQTGRDYWPTTKPIAQTTHYSFHHLGLFYVPTYIEIKIHSLYADMQTILIRLQIKEHFQILSLVTLKEI